MSALHLVTVPKWGLSMEEGEIVAWHKQLGDTVAVGDDLVDIETTKIANTVESPAAGILRKILGESGTTLACGAALCVIGSGDASDDELNAFIAQQALHAAETAVAEVNTKAEPVTRNLDVDGETVRLRYLDRAYGKAGDAGEVPVLLLHGFGGGLENWAFNQSTLAESYRVIAVDLPGHGGSDKRVGDGSAATLARPLAALLDDLDIDAVHLVTHSFGALVGRALHRLRPDRIVTFTAIAPADLAPPSRAYLDGFINAKRRSQMSEALALLFADPTLASSDMAENLLRYKRLDGVDAALRTIDAANFSQPSPAPEALSLWREIGARGFVIWGDADAIVPCSGLEALDPATWHLLIEGAGHMPHIEHADLINAAILAHLQGGAA